LPQPTDAAAVEVHAKNQLEQIPVTFRAVNLNRSGDSTANGRLAFAVEQAIQSSEFVDPKGTKLAGDLEQVDARENTFTFGMVLKLKVSSRD
jgi:hypothetical protein